MKQVPVQSCIPPSSAWSSAGLVTWLICLFQGVDARAPSVYLNINGAFFCPPQMSGRSLHFLSHHSCLAGQGKATGKCQSQNQMDGAGAIELSHPGSRLLEIINISMWVIPGPCYLSTASLNSPSLLSPFHWITSCLMGKPSLLSRSLSVSLSWDLHLSFK